MLSSCNKVCYPPTLPLSRDLGTVLAAILLDEGCYLGFAMQREVRISSDSSMTLALSVKQRGTPRIVCLPCVSSNLPLNAITQSFSGFAMPATDLGVGCKYKR